MFFALSRAPALRIGKEKMQDECGRTVRKIDYRIDVQWRAVACNIVRRVRDELTRQERLVHRISPQ